MLNGDALPWVDNIKHVGNLLESDNSFTQDCRIKRGQFVGRIHSLNQELYYVSSKVKTKLYDIFTLSFYGSSLWPLFGPEVERLHRAYNVAVRMAFRVDRATRTFLIEFLSGCHHPHTLLCSRFWKFHQTNLKCNKPVIRMLAKLSECDMRTVYGNNVRNIDANSLTTQVVKEMVRYRHISPEDEWRLPILTELLFARENNLEIEGLSRRDINDIIRYTCTV